MRFIEINAHLVDQSLNFSINCCLKNSTFVFLFSIVLINRFDAIIHPLNFEAVFYPDTKMTDSSSLEKSVKLANYFRKRTEQQVIFKSANFSLFPVCCFALHFHPLFCAYQTTHCCRYREQQSVMPRVCIWIW